jgi:hypothetical protein
MAIPILCMLGALGCFFALFVLAIVAIVSSDDEPPFFVYCVGFVLVVTGIILLSGAGA